MGRKIQPDKSGRLSIKMSVMVIFELWDYRKFNFCWSFPLFSKSSVINMYLLPVKIILKKYFTYICTKLIVQYFTFSLFISCMPHSSELWLNLFFLFVPSYLGSLGQNQPHNQQSAVIDNRRIFKIQIRNKTSETATMTK